MPVLRLIPAKGEAIVVDTEEALVGREANCNVVVPHPSVSRRHALLKRKQDVFFVVDQGSANGTFVDSKRVVDAALRQGSVLRFGSAAFNVEIGEEAVVESITEEELVVAHTMVGQVPSFSTTVVEPLPEDDPTPMYEMREEVPPPPTVQAALPNPPKPPEPVSQAAPLPRPEPRYEARRMPPAPAPIPAPVVSAQPPSRGPAFWLMIGAGALALLFVGAALGLGAAFVARKLGWL